MACRRGGSADLRIVLLGKTGAGKSSTGNAILGKELFKLSGEAEFKISKCVAKTETVDGRTIAVIDTPGLCWVSDEELKSEITKYINKCWPGPHAFLIVLTVVFQTRQERKLVEDILKMFGEEALNYAVVLFTHGNKLEDDKTIQQFVDENSHLKRLVQKCGNRLHVIDNKHWNNPIASRGDETRNSKEIKKLLNTIDQMVKQNGGKHYSNVMFQAVAQANDEERVNIREESRGKLRENVNIRAKENVRKSFLIQKADASTRHMISGFIGGNVPTSSDSAAAGIELGAADDQIVKRKRGKQNTNEMLQAVAQATEADLRIVLLGKTGAGKSSTGNTILREELFTTDCSGNSVTDECKAETKTVDGKEITVIDTPGYCCTVQPDEELKPAIAKCIIECSPGPHAFLIVLTVVRQTPEEQKVVEEIENSFGEEALKYAVVLFTLGEQLNDKTIQQFVDENSHLKTFVQKCGNRLHVIDNKYWNNPIAGRSDETRNSKEIKQLLNTIDQMVEQNGGKHYTNKMLQAVEQTIEMERVNIREESRGKLRENVVDKWAKKKVLDRFLNNAAGVSTGIVMGALLGVIASVTLAMTIVCTGGFATVVVLGVGAGLGAIVGVATGVKAADGAANAREAAENTVDALTEKLENMGETMKKLTFKRDKKVSYSPL